MHIDFVMCKKESALWITLKSIENKDSSNSGKENFIDFHFKPFIRNTCGADIRNQPLNLNRKSNVELPDFRNVMEKRCHFIFFFRDTFSFTLRENNGTLN